MSVSFEHGANYEDIPNVSSVVVYGVASAIKSATTADGSTKLQTVQDFTKDSLFVLLPEGVQAS